MIYKSPFKIENSLETLNKIKEVSQSGVIIFGTGNFGLLVLTALKKLNINVIGFADNNYSRWNQIWNGYKVYSPKKLKSEFENVPILIASLNFPYMTRQLKKYGIKENIYTCNFLFNETSLDLEECNSMWPELYTWPPKRSREQIDLYIYSVQAYNEKNKLRVNSLDLVLTEKCTLKCKDCSNLMQYYAKPIDEDFDTLVSALNKFMNSVDYVYEIRIIGGEPLIYKKIDLVIKKLLEYKNFGKIHIYTNGTVILKEDKMKVFCNEKVLFRISDYGESSRHVKRLEESEKTKGGIIIPDRITRWQDCAIIGKHERSEDLTKHIFGNCCVNQCLTILHGNLYLCPYSAHAENLKAIPKAKEDSINLNNEKIDTLKEKMYNLYFKKEYLEACKYCNGRDYNVEAVDAAVQTKEVLSYEVMN